MADLVVSAEFVRRGKVGGTEQALLYTLDGLRANLRPDDRLTIIQSEDLGIPSGDQVSVVTSKSGGPRFVGESRTFGRLARTSGAYFFPNYFTPPLPHHGCRVVTTIPDLQYRHLPENFSRRKRAWLSLAHRETLRRADVVTTYSNFVRDDIERHYGKRHADKVRVIPIPVSWDRFGDAAPKSFSDAPYVLSVASHYAHKNLETLIRGFALARKAVRDVRLVIAGQWSSELIGVRRASDLPRMIHDLELEPFIELTGFVSPEFVGNLYRGASAFVFPSLFEGFGLPPVEALGFGTHVITTRCASLPEVTLGLAEYVDNPLDAAELAARITKVIDYPRILEPQLTQQIREHYDPVRLGAEYYRALTGTADSLVDR